jgi:hypothetical protein
VLKVMGLTFGALIWASSMIAYSMSGLAFAASSVASLSRKPTVTMRPQPWSARLVRFGAKSVSEADSTGLASGRPRSPTALVRPS